MKLNTCVLCASFLFLAQGFTHRDVICREGRCYDSQFKPSHEWQIVEEGQSIPPGLHVRLNLETGAQEAKLLVEDDDESENMAVVVPPNEPEQPADAEEAIKPFKKSRVGSDELRSFSSSVDEVLNFSQERDVSRMEKALDTLIDLSHDIEFGAELTKNPRVFQAMASAARSLCTEGPELVEKIYRVMGSSLRNNQQAIENLLVQQHAQFIDGLYEILGDSSSSDTIQKRILGVIQALASYPQYAGANFNNGAESTSNGLQKLISVFPRLGGQAQERTIQILEDLQIPGFEASESEPPRKMSSYLQQFLTQESSRTEEQFKSAVQSLVQLHKSTKLPSSHEFLGWLSREVEERRTGLKKKSALYSGTDADFDSMLQSARHAVFGNPNSRKMDDEL